MTLNSLQKYGQQFQIKVLSSLLTHKELLVNIHDIISEEYFESSAHQWIVTEILAYYDKYKTTPSMDILKVELQKQENDILEISIKEQLKLAYTATDEDKQYIQEEFTNFCKNQQLKRALMASVDLLKAEDFDGVRYLVDNALKAGQDKNIGHDYLVDIESRYREESRITVPTPWDKINKLLVGGLGNGDFGLMFGNPGGGKSWGLVSLGGHAAKLGYNVVHYTLELGEEYVARRYDAFFTEIPVDKILPFRDKVEEKIKDLPGKVIIKEFPTGRATLSTIESHLKKVEDLGTKPDLIIIDYVDLLSSKKKNADRKQEIDDIYTSTKGLARELDIPIWSVSQVNRTGAQDKIIEGDKAAGSYDKMMITDFCISLSRKREDKERGTGRFHIMKNRYGMDGVTYSVKANTSTGHFEVSDYNDDDEDNDFSSTPKAVGPLDNWDKKGIKSTSTFEAFFNTETK